MSCACICWCVLASSAVSVPPVPSVSVPVSWRLRLPHHQFTYVCTRLVLRTFVDGPGDGFWARVMVPHERLDESEPVTRLAGELRIAHASDIHSSHQPITPRPDHDYNTRCVTCKHVSVFSDEVEKPQEEGDEDEDEEIADVVPDSDDEEDGDGSDNDMTYPVDHTPSLLSSLLLSPHTCLSRCIYVPTRTSSSSTPHPFLMNLHIPWNGLTSKATLRP